MNRETLDGIVKQALFAFATSLLPEIGRYTLTALRYESEYACDSILDLVKNREDALALLRDDARRLEIVDRILKEMK